LLEPWLEKGPVIDELVIIGKNLRFDRFVPLTLKANSVSLVVSAGSFLGSLLGTPGVKRWIDIDKVY
jgi:hypothetical protein